MNYSCYLLVLMLSCVLTQACKKNSTANSSDTSNLKIALTSEPGSLDPGQNVALLPGYVICNLFRGLTRIDANLKLVPELAESWQFNASNTQLIFKIKKNIYWSNGTPITAYDFSQTWKRLLNPEFASPNAYYLFGIKDAKKLNAGQMRPEDWKGVQTPNEQTLIINFEAPQPLFPLFTSYWGLYALPLSWAQTHIEYYFTLLEGEFNQYAAFPTSGPFLLKEWQKDVKIVLARNPHFFKAPLPYLNQAEFFILNDESTALNLLESHKIDMIKQINSFDLMRLEQKGWLHTAPYIRGAYLGFNLANPQTQNKHLRKAFAQALDKQMLQDIPGIKMSALNSWFFPGTLGFENNEQRGFAFSPSEAKRELLMYLKERKMNAEQIVLSLQSNNLEESQILTAWLQNQIQQNLGINLRVELMDHKIAQQRWNAGDFEIYLGSWTADFPDATNTFDIFKSDARHAKFMRFQSALYDQLISAAVESTDIAARVHKLKTAEHLILQEELAIIPFYTEKLIWTANPQVKNLQLTPLNYLFLEEVQWTK